MMREKKILQLHRHYAAEGTNGTITFEDTLICYSIELPWRDNVRRVSCIPAGMYALTKCQYPKHGEQVGILAVPGRTAILFHAANVALEELQGCIAPVLRLIGPGQGSHSRQALAKLKALVYSLWDRGYTVFVQIK